MIGVKSRFWRARPTFSFPSNNGRYFNGAMSLVAIQVFTDSGNLYTFPEGLYIRGVSEVEETFIEFTGREEKINSNTVVVATLKVEEHLLH